MSSGAFHDSNHPLFQTTDTFQQLITDLNHFGDNHDSDMRYLDSAIGPGGNLTLAGLGEFTGNTLIDALNELDSDLHGPGGGSAQSTLTTDAKAVVGAINEIEAVFDASAKKINTTGDFTIDIAGDIILDADSADVLLKDGGTQYGALTNNSGALILKSGSTEVFRGDSADLDVARAIQMPDSGAAATPITLSKTVHGALAEINARIPNVYDRNGTLLNPLR